MVEADNEDLAVADLSGLGSRGDGVDGLVDLIRGDSDLDLDLGQEAHGIFGAAIDFRMALLPTVSLDFRHRETVNANGGQGIRTSSSLNGLMIAITIFMGLIPAWARFRQTGRFSLD